MCNEYEMGPTLLGLPSDATIALSPASTATPPTARLFKVALLDLKNKMPLQRLPESAAMLVWPPVSLVDALVSERRFGSPSCSPPRPPVAGSSRTVLLIAVPPSCHLSFRPLCFQAP